MQRVLLVLGIALAVIVALVGAASALAYGPAPSRDGEMTLGGIAAPVAVAWPDSGGVAIEAQTWTDAAAGLGYAHAADNAFEMALWRQTARGETAAWFGDSARAVDLHARRLGLDALARQTYDGLDASARARLDAYARGVNAAFHERAIAQSDAFVWLGLTPEPWQPWDALAVERLVAYLATPAPDSSWTAAVAASPAVAAFVRDDAAFRTTLAVSGTAFGRAFAAPTPAGRALVSHQPAGASALPLVVPVAFHVGGRRVAVASIPGTLSLPSGTDGAAAWAVLLTSNLRVEPFAGAPPMPVYSRVVARDGGETLVAIARDSSGLVLGRAPRGVRRDSTQADSVRADSVAAPVAVARPVTRTDTTAARPDSASTRSAQWIVRWPGFRVGTDAALFSGLAEGRAPGAFALLRGDGLVATSEGTRVLGQPLVASGGVVGGERTARWLPARLAEIAAAGNPLSAAQLAADSRSAWIVRRLPGLVRALGPRDSVARRLEEPVAFLRSWDGTYTTDAIAPTIFEAWLAAHRAFTGHLPDPTDSTDVALLPFTLAIARGTLRDTYGPDAAAWQWGGTQVHARTPVLGRLAGTPGRRYADADAGPGGHPTALRPGPARVPDDADSTSATTRSPGPAVWTTWTALGRARLFVRGPERVQASFEPSEGVADRPGAAVGIDAGAALPERRLTFLPTARRSR